MRSAQWTAGESNPDLRRAMPASSRWTSSPYARMNRHGNRTPLLRDPFSRGDPPARSHEGPPENRTRSPSLPRRCAAGTPADRPAESRPGRTRTCAILCVRQASSPLDDGTSAVSSTGGIRTHRHQALDLAAMPVSVPCHEHRQLRVGESNLRLRAYDTRPGTGPPASPRPRYRAGHAGLMRPGRAPARLERVQSPGEIRTPTPRGHVRLRPARLPIPPPGESSSGPCGNRTRLVSLRG
jgi:hypothetical protein